METIRAAERAEAAWRGERCIVIKHSILWIVRMALKMQSAGSRRHRRWPWRKTVLGAGLCRCDEAAFSGETQTEFMPDTILE